MGNKEYEISSQTIRDIMDKVPQEKWGHVLTDIESLLAQAKAVSSLIEITGKHLIDEGAKASDLIQLGDTVTWVDDGKHENEIHFTDEDSNNHGSIKFGEDGAEFRE